MEEETSFTVRDRRARFDEAAAPDKIDAPPVTANPPITDSEPSTHETAEVSFSSFLLSLATSAMQAMNQNSSQNAPGAAPDAARQIIDMIAMLQEKTRNNLTADESDLLSTVLHNLRMAFITHRPPT